jgi:thiosulfate/3-mercaptopyruvate sulfurtransferase
VLVDPGWLAAHLNDPDVRVVEVDVSPAAYDDWHIDCAALWNVYADLNDADYRTVGAASAERLMARSGIGPDSTVPCRSAASSQLQDLAKQVRA